MPCLGSQVEEFVEEKGVELKKKAEEVGQPVAVGTAADTACTGSQPWQPPYLVQLPSCPVLAAHALTWGI